MMKRERTALILGASGLIGGYITKEILKNSDYNSLTSLVRRSPIKAHTKLNEIGIDFDHLSNYQDHFRVDEVFICLGTTRKKAGSKENFKKVDYEYVVEAAKIAKEQGVKRIAIVSAIGANANSSFFYNKIKGQMENAVTQINIPSTYFFRPSLLLGKREEFRIGEKTGEILEKLIQPALRGHLRKYHSIHASTVAKSMVSFMRNSKKGVHIIESDLMHKIGTL
ncbi:oxidoreductase [Sutcliffiella deserti]|uniref:oxidoreductase n=1 Tax=Sutcliffiella deserti TaxID=2875501 RepID=UPI001CC02EC8|nr:oxidoreductase [Sutcliffiella deserti]